MTTRKHAAALLRITQVHSRIGNQERVVKVLTDGLGLGRIGRSVVLVDTPYTRGMIAKVAHIVRVEPVTEAHAPARPVSALAAARAAAVSKPVTAPSAAAARSVAPAPTAPVATPAPEPLEAPAAKPAAHVAKPGTHAAKPAAAAKKPAKAKAEPKAAAKPRKPATSAAKKPVRKKA
jgi:ribosomal protein L30